MIILEGPDGGGKSRLASVLREHLDWPVNDKVVDHDMQPLENMRDMVDRTLKQGFQRRIFDRYPLLSEPIYGPLFRGMMNPAMSELAWFASAWDCFMKLEPFIIICLPPLAVVKGNLEGDPDNELARAGIEAVWWHYWALYCRLTWPIILYDYTDGTSMVQRSLEHLITQHAERHPS